MTKELDLFGEEKYTAKQLCEQLSVPRRTFTDTVSRIYPGLMRKGITTYFNEEQIAKISKELKKAHNVDLASTRQAAITDLELLDKSRDLMLQLTLRVKELNDENQALKPKAKLAEIAIRDEKEHYSIRDAGKHLGLKQKEMFDLLRSKGLLTMDNLPTSKAIKYKVLQLRSNAEINGRNRPQSIMTMANIHEFQKRYIKEDK